MADDRSCPRPRSSAPPSWSRCSPTPPSRPSSRPGAARPRSTCSTRSTGTRCVTPSRPGSSAGATCARCCCRSPSAPAGRRCTAGTSPTRAYAAPDGLLHWLDLAAATGEVTQTSPRAHPGGLGRRRERPRRGHDDPRPATSWSVLGGGDAEISGVLIGGCTEVLSPMRARRTPTCRRSDGARRRGAGRLPRGLRAGRLRHRPAPARPAPRRLVRARQRRPDRETPAPTRRR